MGIPEVTLTLNELYHLNLLVTDEYEKYKMYPSARSVCDFDEALGNKLLGLWSYWSSQGYGPDFVLAIKLP